MAAAVAKYSRKAARAELSERDPHYTFGGPTLLSQTPANFNDKPPSEKEQAEWARIVDHCEQRFQALWTWRTSYWTTWGEIARYLAPWRYFYYVQSNQYNAGLRNDWNIVDRTGTLAGEVCAAGLMAGLTDPDRDWMKLGPAIPGFELDQAGEHYYEDLTERLSYIYDHSNFYDAQAQHNNDLVFFGTAPVIDYPDADEILHVFTPASGEYMLGTGFDFSDEVFYREFKLTVSQMVEMFGLENCPKDVVQMWTQKGGALEYENVVAHSIEPNFAIDREKGEGSVGVVPGDFTWREVYWLRGKKDQKPLSMTGFHEQPFAVSRWDTTANDPYGRGVGEKMLADVIQLQLETRQKAESIEKVNRPPMGADVSLQNLPASTNPGKITYFNTANGEKKFFPLYEVKPDIAAISADIALIQERIRKTAYNDVFQMMANLREEVRGQITATEVDAMKEEALAQMGPVIGRLHGTLRKRVQRHLAIMSRRGIMPKKPQSLKGVPLKIELVSMLTQARKATQTQAIARTVQFAGADVAAWPEARLKIDIEQAIQEFSDGVGSSSKILRTPREFKKLLQQQQQQAAAAQATELTTQAAQAGSALGKTSLSPNTALSALVGAGQ